ncbi:unnamed protein product [Rotaria socialis]|uniref:Uncharacterized protein n=1 Tax=Rotaria socialis TaxID=392032 RepID=A0A819AV08_9BILA|nr:unnamed protein product [Rotaria socialis]CAF4706493.1 unnamed protein product [Rotaria socialis]
MSGSTRGMAGCYNLNCRPQMAAIELSLPFIQQAIDVLDLTSSSAPLIIADFGSSEGLNSMYAMKAIIEYLRHSKEENRSFLVVHNDLASNHWTKLFELVNNDSTYYGLACGQSFYEQCLPPNSLSVGYSSTSIHWLSRKPCNVSNHCSALFSQQDEFDSFKHQAHIDFSQFLEHRSRELVPGGVLILAIVCVNDEGLCGSDVSKQLLYKCAQSLPLISKELLNYTIPEYLRTYAECVDHDLFSKFSFELVNSQFHIILSEIFSQWQQKQVTVNEFARFHTQFMRSWSESALQQALEANEKRSKTDVQVLLDRFWMMYEQEVKERPHEHDSRSFRTYLVLKKSKSA